MWTSLLALALASQTVGGFVVVKTPDPINGRPRSSAAVMDGKTSLSISCNLTESRGLRVALNDEEPIKGWAGPGMALIVIRFDKNKTITQIWDREDGTVFAKKGSVVRDFVSAMFASSLVVIRLERRDGTTSDKSFRTIGARDAVSTVAKTCGIAVPG